MNWDKSHRRSNNQKRPSKPQKKKKHNPYNKPQQQKGSWGSAPKINLFGDPNKLKSMPSMAKMGKQKINRKGIVDVFDPTVERTKILKKVFYLERMGAFPFNKSPIMPTKNELKKRYNVLKEMGRPLHKYQEEGVEYLCDGSRRLLGDGMGTGKACISSTIVMTYDENKNPVEKTAGEIKVGDKLVGQNGKPCTVKAVYPNKDIKLYKVKFRDGTSVVACEDHQWAIMRQGRAHRLQKKNEKNGLGPIVQISDFKVESTKEVAKRTLVQINKKGKGKNYNYYVPTVEPVQYPEKDLPIDPWVFGFWLAEGWSNSFAVNSHDEDALAKLEKYFHGNITKNKKYNHKLGRYSHCWNFQITGRDRVKFLAGLKEVGLTDMKDRARELILKKHGKIPHSFDCTTKFIPKEYLLASEDQRFDLLCGLMDGDGTVKMSQHKTTNESKGGGCSLSFSSSSYKLHHGIRELVQSLGGLAYIGKPEYKSYTNSEGKTVQTEKASWRTSIKLPNNRIPFTIKRQIDKYVPAERYDKPYKAIESITPFGRGDGVCFTVDEPNSLYCVQHYIVTHNTAQCLASLPNRNKAGTIVVCPTSTKNGWVDEVMGWRPDLEIYSPVRKNQFRFPNPGEICIVGWDSLPTIAPNYRTKIPFVLVLDEAHYAKGHNTGRHKKVSHFMNIAAVVIGLTGTPMPNKVEDLWNVLKVCGMQRLPNEPAPLLGPRSRFARTFFLWEKGDSRPVNCHPEIVVILKKLMKRRTARDIYPNLPPITMTRLICPVKPEFRKKLDSILARAGGEEEFRRKVESAINLIDKNGEVDEHLMTLRAQIDIAKLPEIETWLDQAEQTGEHVVLYSPFRAIVNHLFNHRKKWGVIRGGMSDQEKSYNQRLFNEGKLNGIAITNSGATGINLPGPSDNPCLKMFRTSLDWSPATNDQVIKRIDRFAKKLAASGGINMNHKIQIYDFYFDHKVDEIVWTVIKKKRSILDSMGLRADVDKSKGAKKHYYDVGTASTGHNSSISAFGNGNKNQQNQRKRGRR